MRVMSAVAVLVLAAAAPGAAQQAQQLQPGVPVRMRVTLPGEGRTFTTSVTGVLHALTPESVLVRRAGSRGDSQIVRVARPAVVRLEYLTSVTTTVHSRPGLWALGGGVLGFAAGVLVMAQGSEFNPWPPAAGTFLGVMVGYGVGASQGGTRVREAWQPADLAVPDNTKPGSGAAPGLREQY